MIQRHNRASVVIHFNSYIAITIPYCVSFKMTQAITTHWATTLAADIKYGVSTMWQLPANFALGMKMIRNAISLAVNIKDAVLMAYAFGAAAIGKSSKA